MLADEEVKHYKAIKKMKQGQHGEMAETHILDDARNVFVQMRNKADELAADQEQTELYEKAQQIERRSQQFYQEKAGGYGAKRTRYFSALSRRFFSFLSRKSATFRRD
jgi:hypothetical protein